MKPDDALLPWPKGWRGEVLVLCLHSKSVAERNFSSHHQRQQRGQLGWGDTRDRGSHKVEWHTRQGDSQGGGTHGVGGLTVQPQTTAPW